MKIFQTCRKYGISLKPKDTIFNVTKGKRFCHIILKDGIIVDLEQVKVISQLPFPDNNKTMQSFGKMMTSWPLIPTCA
jgi:hypothetical protein